MSRGAFSDLKLTPRVEPPAEALDQRLFGPLPTRAQVYPPATIDERANGGTPGSDNARTGVRANGATSLRSSAIRRPPTEGSTGPRRNAREPQRAVHRPAARAVERHAHDIFQDQVRWMNRLKLDLEERYGVKVTGNAMVQLALDLFRDDFERNEDQSNLIRVLVNGGSWRRENAEDEAGEQRTEEGNG